MGAGTILKLATQFCCGPKTAPKNNVYFKKKKKKRDICCLNTLFKQGGGNPWEKKNQGICRPLQTADQNYQGIKDIGLKTLLELMRIY